MASRMKKMFHRKRDDDQGQSPNSTRSNPTLGTSLYESTSAAGQPQQGDYPIKGNDSSATLHQQGRKSSIRSRRSSGSQFNVPWRSPTPDQQAARRTPRMSPPPGKNSSGTEQPAPYQHQAPMPAKGQGDRKRWSRTPLPQNFANLSLGDDGPRTVTQTVTTTSFSPGPNEHRNEYHNPSSDLPSRSYIPPRVQSATQPPNTFTDQKQQSKPIQGIDAYNNSSGHQGYGYDSERQPSVPRKQVGTVGVPHNNNLEPSSPHSAHLKDGQQMNGISHVASDGIPTYTGLKSSKVQQPRTDYEQRANDGRFKSTASALDRNGNVHPQMQGHSQAPGVLDKSRPKSTRATNPQDAQNVVDRANFNTKDTQVTESVAPAVTHETVHQKVHHVREELITKEIHTHDVFHRMLPVIDVEVLPPRHFLPVEGGGLVEVSASDVPGRGSNWVIAETASKIPSDQAASKDTRSFTARHFPGREGDTVRRNVDGHERTEETWVHPPELETGARDTGQSWPMMLGNEVPRKGTHSHTPHSAAKKEKPGRSSMSIPSRARHSDDVGMVG